MNLQKLSKTILKPLDNQIVETTVRVALILYASLIAPELPDMVAKQLNNLAVRSVLIFLIAYLSVKDPVTAALATIALMVTVLSLQRREVQGVVSKVASLAGGVVDRAEDIVEGAVGTVGNVLSKWNPAPAPAPAPAPVKEEKAVVESPMGVEIGMDDAGTL